MDELKLYAASGIFVLATVLKLLLPSHTEQLRSQVVSLIDMDMDYRAVITQVGAFLSDESVRQVITWQDDVLDPPSPSPTPVSVTEPPEPIPTVSVVSPGVLAAVEAFHLSQEAYSNYATPTNVCYDDLVLPFNYAAPVDAVQSSGFGYRVHPIDGVVMFHYGTDYDVGEGTPIAAFADGTVTAVGEEAGYGNYVIVAHADGWETLYAHCSSVTVGGGQSVAKGDVIAYSGDTGRVTGPHLHFELSHNELYTNPEFFLQ